jgi:hypothetical protein
MFCDVFSAHQTNASQPLVSQYLTEANWSKIRFSKYYKSDYDYFSSPSLHPNHSGSFSGELYLQYPPLVSRSSE